MHLEVKNYVKNLRKPEKSSTFALEIRGIALEWSINSLNHNALDSEEKDA